MQKKKQIRYEEKLILKENSFFFVVLAKYNEICIGYCSKLYEDNYAHVKIRNTSEIIIGNNYENHIVYNIPLICQQHIRLYSFNGSFFVEPCCDSDIPIYVNDISIGKEEKVLNNGDRIFFMGLNIIYNNRSLFVNNPFKRIKINSRYFEINVRINKVNRDLKAERYIIRPPRILELNKENISILLPRLNNKTKEMPLFLAMGTSLSMGLMSTISISQTLYNYSKGQTKFDNMIFSLLMSFSMLFAMIMIPIITRKCTRRLNKKEQKKEEDRYEKYIQDKVREINKIKEKYRRNLNYVYPDVEECINIIMHNSTRLWERKITDNDFLVIRLGTGDIASNVNIDVTINEEMNEEKSKSMDLLKKCLNDASKLSNAPMLISLKENKLSALVIENEKEMNALMQCILLQLITFHSYNELKIVFLLKNNNKKKWNYIKMFPHIWNNQKDVRFFAETPNEFNEISNYLKKEIIKRRLNKDENKTFLQHYLIIIDDYKSVENLGFMNELLEEKSNIGFSVLFLASSIDLLPNECHTIIKSNGKQATLIKISENSNRELEFTINTSVTIYFSELLRKITNTSIKFNGEDERLLPTSYTFLEMFGVNNIDELDIWKRWNNNDITHSLSTPIGIDETGNIINLDIHENYHGPHGLIAGSTGSGKSKFIITYILSLIVNYHPDDVTFVLIDYKGGDLVAAFQREDVKIPHLVGTITNIDKSGLQRSLESINSELKRRQIEFNNAKNETGESTMDIYKYQKYYHEGILKKNISHLFIICDEFAELKQQEEEFMDEIISIARIGRSLGIHLILATQKPSGVINDQIRSNTKFGICLKVQTKADSMDVIGANDAAKLTRAGQFYLKVGNDDYMTLGQSGWAGAEYNPRTNSKDNSDNYVEFISNTGEVIKRVEKTNKKENASLGDQNTNIVKYICELAKSKGIKEEQLWLENMPENIYLEDLRKKYNVKTEKNIIMPVIGEYDDPSQQKQDIMLLNLSEAGNTIIYGNAESGKETLISTMVYDIITNYSPDEVNIYIMDFGTESTKIFKNTPHVGDVILSNDREKIYRFLVMLNKLVVDRKKKLSKYGGDYQFYLKKEIGKMPLNLIIINNYDLFAEMYEYKFGESLQAIVRDGMNLGIIFVIVTATTGSIRYRMQQNFKHKIALKMNKDDDYGMIFEHLGKKRPSLLFGRGLVQLEDKKIYEYQLAKVCETENWNEKMLETISILNRQYKIKANEIATVPSVVTINDVKKQIKGLSSLPVGVSHNTLDIATYDFKKNKMSIISTKNLDDISDFILNIIEEIRFINEVEYIVIDAEKILNDVEQDIKEEYITFFKKMRKEQNIGNYIVIIIGLNKFIRELGGEEIFKGSLEEGAKYNNFNIIIFESYRYINDYRSKEWFNTYISGDDGIWVGPGMVDQYLFKVDTKMIQNNCTKSYGYSVKKGEANLIKIIGMHDKKGDEESE
jgi:S-DNA-T family DNA segregation ATPase FtsK/SpoIIIE